jgi:DnaJ-class molecular chaperone
MYTHGFSVDYNTYSSYGGCAPSEETANEKCREMIQYYKDLGYPIRNADVHQVCSNCRGHGVFIHKHKRTRKVLKRIDCVKCEGRGYIVLYQVNP